MNPKNWLVGVALLLSLALAACQPVPTRTVSPLPAGDAAQPTSEPAAEPTAVPAAEPGAEPGAEPSAEPSAEPAAGMAEADMPPAALAMRQVLAQQMGVDPADVAVLEAEPVDWPDSCLGAGGPEEMCAAVITPGYRIVLEVNGDQYVYHTNEDGSYYRLVEAPEVSVGDAIVEYTSTNDIGLCQKTIVGTQGVAYGGCYTDLQMGGRLVFDQRKQDLEYFRTTFAPFQATTPTGDVVFNGQGSQDATPAEQRLLGEWMYIVTAEAMSGRTSAGLGLMFAVFQEGGIAALCRNVSVYASGVAYVADCATEPPITLPVVRLNSAQLEQVFGWQDALQSFEDKRVDGTADVMTTTVFFAGRGEAAPGDAEKAAIEGLSAELAAQAGEMAAARVGSCPEPGEGQALYRSETNGYCLLYPTTHGPVEYQENGTAFVVDGDIMQHTTPRLDVTVTEATGTADDAADALLVDVSQAMDPETLPRSVVAFGPVGAVVLDGVPGQDLRRVVFAVHDGRLYTLSFTPADGPIDELYALVVEASPSRSNDTANRCRVSSESAGGRDGRGPLQFRLIVYADSLCRYRGPLPRPFRRVGQPRQRQSGVCARR